MKQMLYDGHLKLVETHGSQVMLRLRLAEKIEYFLLSRLR